MTNLDNPGVKTRDGDRIAIVRHREVCRRLQVSGAKLFDMIAKGIFPRPFRIIPNGRAVGWLETDVNRWILDRHTAESLRSERTSGARK